MSTRGHSLRNLLQLHLIFFFLYDALSERPMACKFYDGFELCEGIFYTITFDEQQPLVVDKGRPSDSLSEKSGDEYFKTNYGPEPVSPAFLIYHSTTPGNFRLAHWPGYRLTYAHVDQPSVVGEDLRAYREAIPIGGGDPPLFRLHNNYDGTVQLRTGEANYVLGAIHNGPEVSWQKCCPLLLGRHTPQVYFFSGGYRSSNEGSFTRARFDVVG
mmetsp:Transcript_8032/g.14783  ORF Transcript_8032/g.14783 Transcript_8032/m.14783 type:complete len:214 (-) Transcript_8032:1226-1867(-)|eukprot:CAMPEP_0184543938 /NCGR_PEP_ID=MMETSP0199_2-20130426/3285_1 /TAXON_ID=1112570 /ORGANISM="Thraustochytrium sp., Strain LLF1b" /LENGTH=213 /DNA_ID=CAMNT_0026938043 /DNA_START=76 /DNA_END=717 /DNA_ORIENTATION=-